MKNCKYCGSEFEPDIHNPEQQIFCPKSTGTKCRIREKYIRRTYGVSSKKEYEDMKKTKNVLICVMCGKKFNGHILSQKSYCNECNGSKRNANAVYQGIKIRAQKRNIPFDLDEIDIVSPHRCPILGIILERGGKYRYNSPSVDRIDNSKGYTKDNIQVVSQAANSLKLDMPIEVWNNIKNLIHPL